MKSLRAEIYDNIAVMLSSGLTIRQALTTAGRGKGKLHRAIATTPDHIKSGKTLVEALELHRTLFADIDRGIIGVGEATGHLPECFRTLAQWHTFKTNQINNMLSLLWYPLILFHLAPVIGNFPALFSGKLSAGGYLFAILSFLMVLYVPVLAGLGLHQFSKRDRSLRIFLERSLLKIPLLSRALKHLGFGRFCHLFVLLYKTGMPLEICAEIAARNCGNAGVGAMFQKCASCVRQGRAVSRGFSEEVPHDFVAMWKTAELTGNLEGTLAKMATSYLEQGQAYFKTFAQAFSRLIEIGVILIVAKQILSQYEGVMSSRALDF